MNGISSLFVSTFQNLDQPKLRQTHFSPNAIAIGLPTIPPPAISILFFLFFSLLNLLRIFFSKFIYILVLLEKINILTKYLQIKPIQKYDIECKNGYIRKKTAVEIGQFIDIGKNLSIELTSFVGKIKTISNSKLIFTTVLQGKIPRTSKRVKKLEPTQVFEKVLSMEFLSV